MRLRRIRGSRRLVIVGRCHSCHEAEKKAKLLRKRNYKTHGMI